MRTVTSLADRRVLYALPDGPAVDAQPILFGRPGGCTTGAGQMADAAVYRSDFLVRVGYYVEVAAGTGSHAVDRYRIPRLINISAEKTFLTVTRKTVRLCSRRRYAGKKQYTWDEQNSEGRPYSLFSDAHFQCFTRCIPRP